MATAVLSSTPTIIDNADSAAAWVGDTFILEGDDKVQGLNSVTCVLTPSAGSGQDVYVAGSWNFTTGVHLRMWQKNTLTPYLQTMANNGIQILLGDASNTAYYTVGGSDTYGGGWVQFVLNTDSTPTSGTVNKAAITKIGFRFNVAVRPKNAINLWMDAWYYGPGYTVTGGTSGDEIDWTHIAALDKVQAYGVTEIDDDIVFLTGDVRVGSGATATYFKSGQKIQFRNKPVSSTLYGVTFQGSACNVDISGGSYGAAGSQNFLFDASDTNLNSFTLTGVQFNKANSVLFSTGESITNNVFDNCGQVKPSTSAFTNNTFSNSVDTVGALLFPSDSGNISDLQFINNDISVAYDSNSDDTPTFTNFVFDDLGYDVKSTDGAITIVISGTGNANSYDPAGGVVTFSNPNWIKIIVKNESTGVLLPDARVHVVADAGGSMTEGDIIINAEITGIDGEVIGNLNYTDQPFKGLVTETATPGLFVPKPISGTIPSGGLTVNVGLVYDE